jgi:hypothetical protein
MTRCEYEVSLGEPSSQPDALEQAQQFRFRVRIVPGAAPIRRASGGRTVMIVPIRTVYGDRLWIDDEDLVRARRRGRKLIPIRDGSGARRYRNGDGDLLLHIDNITREHGQ